MTRCSGAVARVLGLLVVLAAPAALWPGGAHAATAGYEFVESVISDAVPSAAAVQGADIDGDGDVDVVAASTDDDTVRWFENDGSESFTSRGLTLTLVGASDVFAVDVDGDGDEDVIACGTTTVAWIENQDGNMAAIAESDIYSSGSSYVAVVGADLDGDSNLDVVAADNGLDELWWFQNDGSSTSFTAEKVDGNAVAIRDCVVVDLDDDGDQDLLGALDGSIARYDNDGGASFTKSVLIPVTYSATSLFSIDMDLDGDMDVLSANLGTPGGTGHNDSVVWYENDGTESFSTHVVNATLDGAADVFAVDLEGDGDVDVFAASSNDDRIVLYVNDGAESFDAQSQVVVSSNVNGVGSIYAADMDADGLQDVLSASSTADSILWYGTSILSSAPSPMPTAVPTTAAPTATVYQVSMSATTNTITNSAGVNAMYFKLFDENGGRVHILNSASVQITSSDVVNDYDSYWSGDSDWTPAGFTADTLGATETVSFLTNMSTPSELATIELTYTSNNGWNILSFTVTIDSYEFEWDPASETPLLYPSKTQSDAPSVWFDVDTGSGNIFLGDSYGAFDLLPITAAPTMAPSTHPTTHPSRMPSVAPTAPTSTPTWAPTLSPTVSSAPTVAPTALELSMTATTNTITNADGANAMYFKLFDANGDRVHIQNSTAIQITNAFVVNDYDNYWSGDSDWTPAGFTADTLGATETVSFLTNMSTPSELATIELTYTSNNGWNILSFTVTIDSYEFEWDPASETPLLHPSKTQSAAPSVWFDVDTGSGNIFLGDSYGAFDLLPLTASPTRAPTISPAPTAAPTQSCLSGTYRVGTECEDCAAGRFSVIVDQSDALSNCSACPAGTSSSSGADSCADCAANEYSAFPGSLCSSCPTGKFSPSASTLCRKHNLVSSFLLSIVAMLVVLVCCSCVCLPRLRETALLQRVLLWGDKYARNNRYPELYVSAMSLADKVFVARELVGSIQAEEEDLEAREATRLAKIRETAVDRMRVLLDKRRDARHERYRRQPAAAVAPAGIRNDYNTDVQMQELGRLGRRPAAAIATTTPAAAAANVAATPTHHSDSGYEAKAEQSSDVDGAEERARIGDRDAVEDDGAPADDSWSDSADEGCIAQDDEARQSACTRHWQSVVDGWYRCRNSIMDTFDWLIVFQCQKACLDVREFCRKTCSGLRMLGAALLAVVAFLLICFMHLLAMLVRMAADIFLVLKSASFFVSTDALRAAYQAFVDAFKHVPVLRAPFEWMADLFIFLFPIDMKVFAVSGLEVTCDGANGLATLVLSLFAVVGIGYAIELHLVEFIQTAMSDHLKGVAALAWTQRSAWNILVSVSVAAFGAILNSSARFVIQLIASLVTIRWSEGSAECDANSAGGAFDSFLAGLANFFLVVLALPVVSIVLTFTAPGIPAFRQHANTGFLLFQNVQPLVDIDWPALVKGADRNGEPREEDPIVWMKPGSNAAWLRDKLALATSVVTWVSPLTQFANHLNMRLHSLYQQVDLLDPSALTAIEEYHSGDVEDEEETDSPSCSACCCGRRSQESIRSPAASGDDDGHNPGSVDTEAHLYMADYLAVRQLEMELYGDGEKASTLKYEDVYERRERLRRLAMREWAKVIDQRRNQGNRDDSRTDPPAQRRGTVERVGWNIDTTFVERSKQEHTERLPEKFDDPDDVVRRREAEDSARDHELVYGWHLTRNDWPVGVELGALRKACGTNTPFRYEQSLRRKCWGFEPLPEVDDILRGDLPVTVAQLAHALSLTDARLRLLRANAVEHMLQQASVPMTLRDRDKTKTWMYRTNRMFEFETVSEKENTTLKGQYWYELPSTLELLTSIARQPSPSAMLNQAGHVAYSWFWAVRHKLLITLSGLYGLWDNTMLLQMRIDWQLRVFRGYEAADTNAARRRTAIRDALGRLFSNRYGRGPESSTPPSPASLPPSNEYEQLNPISSAHSANGAGGTGPPSVGVHRSTNHLSARSSSLGRDEYGSNAVVDSEPLRRFQRAEDTRYRLVRREQLAKSGLAHALSFQLIPGAVLFAKFAERMSESPIGVFAVLFETRREDWAVRQRLPRPHEVINHVSDLGTNFADTKQLWEDALASLADSVDGDNDNSLMWCLKAGQMLLSFAQDWIDQSRLVAWALAASDFAFLTALVIVPDPQLAVTYVLFASIRSVLLGSKTFDRLVAGKGINAAKAVSSSRRGALDRVDQAQQSLNETRNGLGGGPAEGEREEDGEGHEGQDVMATSAESRGSRETDAWSEHSEPASPASAGSDSPPASPQSGRSVEAKSLWKKAGRKAQHVSKALRLLSVGQARANRAVWTTAAVSSFTLCMACFLIVIPILAACSSACSGFSGDVGIVTVFIMIALFFSGITTYTAYRMWNGEDVKRTNGRDVRRSVQDSLADVARHAITQTVCCAAASAVLLVHGAQVRVLQTDDSVSYVSNLLVYPVAAGIILWILATLWTMLFAHHIQTYIIGTYGPSNVTDLRNTSDHDLVQPYNTRFVQLQVVGLFVLPLVWACVDATSADAGLLTMVLLLTTWATAEVLVDRKFWLIPRLRKTHARQWWPYFPDSVVEHCQVFWGRFCNTGPMLSIRVPGVLYGVSVFLLSILALRDIITSMNVAPSTRPALTHSTGLQMINVCGVLLSLWVFMQRALATEVLS